MLQPAVHAPSWQNVPLEQELCCASLALLEVEVLTPGWQLWQLPLGVPEE